MLIWQRRDFTVATLAAKSRGYKNTKSAYADYPTKVGFVHLLVQF
jgi:hypothetical protein